jgi:hypothetical protein
MFGYRENELIGQSISILIPQRFRKAHESGMARVAASGKARLINETVELFGITKVRKLSGLLPICASCKKIRDDKGYWNQIETYIRDHSEAEFSHGICPECFRKIYPEYHRGKSEKKLKSNKN